MARNNGKILLQPGKWVWVEWDYDGNKVATVGYVVNRTKKLVELCQSRGFADGYIGPPPREIPIKKIAHVEEIEVEGGE